MNLAGKRALITGAGIRLGRALAEGLAGRGMELALHYHRHGREAENLAKKIRARGGRAQTFGADLSLPAEAERLAAEVEAGESPIEVLVLSAALYPRESVAEITGDSMERTLRTNLVSPFLLARRLGLGMKHRGEGAILTLLDWSVDRPDPMYLPYQISKAGLREATYGLALALAPEVRVNGIAPGAVLLPEGTSDAKRTRVQGATPLDRLGTPSDVVGAALYLLGSAEFLTGVVLKVDGGRSLR